MKKCFSLYFFIIVSLFFSSCYYDNEEELYPENTCKTTDMSYTNNVLPILQDNCYTCHNQATNTAGVTLEGYTNLKFYVDNGKLLGVIKHQPGFPEMPNGRPQLEQCQIDKIDAWVIQGAPDN